MKSQTMNGASANPNAPRLRIRQSLEQPIGGAQTIITNFKFTCFNVNGDNLILIVLLNLGSDFGFIEGITSLGKFFFAISGLSDCHKGCSEAERVIASV
jgi:hypothetical protein